MGAWLGLSLLKFGDPVVLDQLVVPPANFTEFMALSWPLSWSYGMFAVVLVFSFKSRGGWPGPAPWLAWLPLLWLGWELVAAASTVDPRLTAVTIKHFVMCTACFYLGFICLNRGSRPWFFWGGVFAAFVVVVWIGFGQHYGGLEATRKFFYEQPDGQRFPPEYLKRLARDRIFSTLVYPNALAGVILLLLPPLVVGLWNACCRLSFVPRSVVVGLFVYSGLACLVWSGSKAAWLIVLVVAWIAVFKLPIGRRAKFALAAVALILGGVGFGLRYAGYFERGATSVVARFDYWIAALSITRSHPIVGTGPGTFAVAYAEIKPPGAEMAHLTHNDYLEQACDSGIPGFLVYFCLWCGILTWLYRNSHHKMSLFQFAIWLGLIGWALQAVVEFCLYIPASSWIAFTLLGSQLGLLVAANKIDKSALAR
jgi:hypothetical protein